MSTVHLAGRARRTILVLLIVITGAALPCAAAMEKQSVMIPMPDGVRLATDIYLPKTDGKVPVVLVRTTYGRDGGMANLLMPFFEGKGVAFAIQDTRGLHGSEGVSSAFIDDPLDGFETVEWLAAQPWCNGRVGTAGISALGITQYLMHKKPPPHLVCQDVMAAPESLYHTVAYQGGAVRRSLFFGWVVNQGYSEQVMSLILSQVDYTDMWRMMDLSADYGKVNVPIMHMTGWYDLYLRGNIHAFNGIQEKGGPNARGRQRLVIGPWTHSGFLGLMPNTSGELAYPPNSNYDIQKVIAWFQECLQGKDKGFLSGPAVRYYVMGDPEDPDAPGNEWRTADSWPVPAAATPYYFHKDGALSVDKPAEADAAISFTDDPANPVPTLGSSEHGMERHTVDLRPIEQRPDVLVFSTPPLAEPVEVTGPITARVYFTTDVVDTDFAVRLADVYPDGRSMLVTDGIIRASHRESFNYRVPLVPGDPYAVDIEIWPTSLIFNKGHRIRVIVSATNFPRFDINHHTGRYHYVSPGELARAKETGLLEYIYTPDTDPGDKIAHTTLHLSADRPSHIILPIVK